MQYYEIRKLTKGKTQVHFRPFMPFGNPSFTVLIRVEALDKNESELYFEVRAKFFVNSVQKVEFFE